MFSDPDCSISYVAVPHYTEARIEQLCTQAIAVRDPEDIQNVILELRSALELHIRLAKESLETQASTISALNSKTDDRSL
jgi:hypothetical protein